MHMYTDVIGQIAYVGCSANVNTRYSVYDGAVMVEPLWEFSVYLIYVEWLPTVYHVPQ